MSLPTNSQTSYLKSTDDIVISRNGVKMTEKMNDVILNHKATATEITAGVSTMPNTALVVVEDAVQIAANTTNAILANPATPVPAAVTSALLGKEDLSNKATTLASPNHTKYPTTKAVADAIAAIPAALPTNLTNTAAPTKVTVNSSTGTPTDLPLATTTNAGLLAPAEKVFINSNHSAVNNTFGTITDTNPNGSTTNAVANWGLTNDLGVADPNVRFYVADATNNVNGTMKIANVKTALGVTTPLIYDGVAFLGTDTLNSSSNPVRFNPADAATIYNGSDNSKTITSFGLESKSATVAETLATGTAATNKKLINKQDLDAFANTKISGVKVDGLTLIPDANGYVNVTDNDVTGISDSSSVDLTLVGTTVSGVIKTAKSVTTNGDTTPVELVNDSAAPGNNKFYGTSATGVKGFQNLPASATADQISIQGDGSATPFNTVFADINVTNDGTNTTTSINTQELKNQIQTNQYKRGVASLIGQSGTTDSNGTQLTDIYIATLDYPITTLEANQEFVLRFDTDSQTLQDPNNPGSFYSQFIDVGTGAKPLQIETKDAGIPFRDIGLYDIRKQSVHTVVYNLIRDIFQLVDPAEALPFDTSTVQTVGNIAQISQVAGNATTSRRIRVTDQGFPTDIFVDDLFSVAPTKNALGKIILPSAPVSSVFGRTGAVVAAAGDYTTTQVTEGTNLYYTDARARNAVNVSGTPLTYNPATGIFGINIASPTQSGALAPGDYTTFSNKQNAITPANVTAGSTKVTLGGTPTGATLLPFSIDVNEANFAVPQANVVGLTTALGLKADTAQLNLKQDKTSVAIASIVAGTTTTTQTIRITDQGINNSINVDDLFSIAPTKDALGKIVLPLPITLDGNNYNVVSADAVVSVAPTNAQVPTVGLVNGDTATKFLTDNKIEYWAYTNVWSLIKTVNPTTLDGNDTHLQRGNAVAGVTPTVIEIPTPMAGDTAKVYLTSGAIEFWSFLAGWNLNFTSQGNVTVSDTATGRTTINAGVGQVQDVVRTGAELTTTTFSNTTLDDSFIYTKTSTGENVRIQRIENTATPAGAAAFSLPPSSATLLTFTTLTAANTPSLLTLPGGAFINQKVIITNVNGATASIANANTDSTTTIVVPNGLTYIAIWNGFRWAQESNIGVAATKPKRITQTLVAGNNVITHSLALLAPFWVNVSVRNATTGAVITAIKVPVSETTNTVTINVGAAVASAEIDIIPLV
jgi:hypothetical protein